MKRLTRLVALGLAVALLGALVLPLTAQEPGSGGTIIESNIGDDPTTFNPIISSDATSSDVWGFMYPAIIAADDVTLEPAPNVPGGLAESWEYDETGTVLTITLRDDLTWSDGTPITSADYLWAFNATKSGETSSVRTSVIYQLDDGTVTGGTIHAVEAIDDFTVQVTLGDVQTDENGEVVVDADGNPELVPNCDALNDINDITVVPAHVYGPAFDGDLASMNNDPYFVPETDTGFATYGPFTDPFIEFGVQVSLLADQNYPDTVLEQGVIPGEWLLQQVENQTVEFERFLAGDFTLIGVTPNEQNNIRGDERFQFIEYPANGYTYMGYNLADPTNPQPGLDENGELIDQGIHPIFGDVRVRQALAYGVNVREIIGTRPTEDAPATGILEGNGFEQATHNHPGLSSVDPGVDPYPFEPETAAALLEEAGWVDNDGDGIRECTGCLYAETVDPEFEGSPLTFELLTNTGNVIREATGETIQAQLAEVGVDVDYRAIEFGTLVGELLGQEFDAIIIGWSLAIPFNPGSSLRNLFGPGADRPGAGFNLASYQNPEAFELVARADSLPAAEDGSYAACDETVRNELYGEALRMLWEDQPYMWLYAGNVMVAAQGTLENFDPLPYNPSWNIDSWSVGE